jgi:ATP-binding cassette subfamily B protein
VKNRRLTRLAAVLFFDGFRAAPGFMSLVTAMLVLGGVAVTAYPLGYRVLVDGALAGSPSRIAWGVVIVGGLSSVGWILVALGGTESMALSDRIAVYHFRSLVTLIAGVPGLEHLERPDYLTEVEQLNTNRRQLAAAPRQVMSNLSNAARIVALLVLLASVSPWLLFLPVAAVPPLAADRVAKRITKRSENAMAPTRRLASMLFALTSDVQSAGEVRAYGLTPHLKAEHARLSRELDRSSAREALQVLAVQGLGWLVYSAGLMAAIAFVVLRATHGALSLGTVLMAVSLIRRSRNQLATAAAGSGQLVGTLATVDRLFWLQDHAEREAAGAGTLPAPESLTTGISLRSVSFTYPGREKPVLQDFSADLPAGATVAVVGENGSGKTTLVKLLLGLYRPDAGEIVVDRTPLRDLDPEAWRSRCTAAFQDFSRLHLPAVETVGVAELPALDDEPAALRALERAGGDDLPGQLPQSLSTRVGTAYTGGHGLSGGQWQKLALGRAMRRPDPLLVILDEPTASLDARAEYTLFQRYADTARTAAGRTGAVTVLVSHRFATARSADLILFVEHGQATEIGSHEELVAAGGKYAELFELQASAYR